MQSKTPPLRPNSASARGLLSAFFAFEIRRSTYLFIVTANLKFHPLFYKILIPFRIECIEIPFIKSPIKTEV
ncbi:hypothetical protein [Campylobacter sp.]|uniref:hypothetical protein n=1 Tax=Campylobacter sp. TaxID=205 RepID=UPI0025EAE22D|nr:hypothetical protein [Campylobacter sp.]